MSNAHFRTRHLRLVAGLAAVVGSAACGPLHHGPGSAPAKLFFTNESLDQADVYAVIPGSQSIRIGTVMAGQTDTLTVPADITARGDNVNVVARLLAHSGAIRAGRSRFTRATASLCDSRSTRSCWSSCRRHRVGQGRAPVLWPARHPSPAPNVGHARA